MPHPNPVNLLSDAANAGEVTVRHAGRSRTEPFDATDTLAKALDRREFIYDRSADAIRLAASEIAISPRVVGVFALPDGRVQTACTIVCRHRTAFPDSLFEYQYAVGRYVSASLATGFNEWIENDLDVLIEAVTNEVDRCTVIDLVVPGTADRPTRRRRAYVGPVELRGSSADPSSMVAPPSESEIWGPSRMLTRNADAFAKQIDSDALVAIRFYVVRQSDGTVGADCRVNGAEHDPGTVAGRKYVRTWPGKAPRAERQYVVIRNVPPDQREPIL